MEKRHSYMPFFIAQARTLMPPNEKMRIQFLQVAQSSLIVQLCHSERSEESILQG